MNEKIKRMDDYFRLKGTYGIYSKLGKKWGMTRGGAVLYVQAHRDHWEGLKKYFANKRLDF